MSNDLEHIDINTIISVSNLISQEMSNALPCASVVPFTSSAQPVVVGRSIRCGSEHRWL
jgi:hypothetical protein